MAITMRRIVDFSYAAVLMMHMLLALAMDFQLIFGNYYPQSFQTFFVYYAKKYKDCMALAPPVWLKGFMWLELVTLMPFLPIGIYAFCRGLRRCSWIRIPTIIYSTLTPTIVFAIIAEYYATNFTGYTTPCPTTSSDRIRVIAVYASYVILPLIILLDMVFIAGPARGNNGPNKNAPKKKNTPKSQKSQ